MHISLAVVLIVAIGFDICSGFGSPASSLTLTRRADVSMKIFDWKKREAYKTFEIPEDYELSVNTIFPFPGSRKRPKRVGRGIAAGQGGSCGRGMRGQKSRKGEGAGVRAGFEGGQTALYRRLPKLVGKPMRNHKKTKYSLIKLHMLNEVEDNSEVDYHSLQEMGVVTKPKRTRRIFKVVGGDALERKGLVVKAHAFTSSARAAIEENGGRCVLMSTTKPITLEEAIKEKKVLRTEQRKKLKARRALFAARDREREAAAVAALK